MKHYLLSPKSFFHPLVNYYRRLKYGAGCCDTWSLYYYLAKIILPSLKEFEKSVNGYPTSLSEKEWKDILDKMIWSFDYILNGEDDWSNTLENQENYKKQQEGLELFGKYFTNLWR